MHNPNKKNCIYRCNMLNASNKFLIRFLINQVQKFYVSIRSSNPTSSLTVSPLVQVLFVIAMTSSTMMVMENKTTFARIIGLSSTILSMCSFAVGIGLAIYVAHEKINLLSFPMKLLPTKGRYCMQASCNFNKNSTQTGYLLAVKM